MAVKSKKRRGSRIVVVSSAPPSAPTRAARKATAIVRRAASQTVQVVREARRSPRAAARRAASGALRVGGVMAIAQAKILPGVAAGYLIGMVERDQRKKHAAAVEKKKDPKDAPVGGAIIANPMYRLVGYAGLLAVGAAKTSGMVRDGLLGAAGAVGVLAEMYRNTDGSNPEDSYMKVVSEGGAGI